MSATFERHLYLMICSICNQKVPFGLPMHMLAAHGPKRSGFLRNEAALEKKNQPKGGKRPHAKGRRGKPTGKRPLKHPRLSKLS